MALAVPASKELIIRYSWYLIFLLKEVLNIVLELFIVAVGISMDALLFCVQGTGNERFYTKIGIVGLWFGAFSIYPLLITGSVGISVCNYITGYLLPC